MTAMREVWGNTLAELIEHDPRVVVLDGDLANSTKADIVDQRHPHHFLQMGIAEQNLVGAAAGLASMGFVPWLSSFAVFLTHRALDPVRMLVAQTGANVKIAGSYSGLLTGATGRTHQDVQDLAIMRAMPDMTVIAPADAAECASAVRWATAYNGPVYLRLARDPVPAVFDDAYQFVPGVVWQLRDGDDVTLVSTGAQTARVVEAADLLARDGINARHLHVPTLKPLDPHALLEQLGTPSLVVTVEDHTVIGGLGGLVAEALAEHNNGERRLRRIGIKDVWGESAPNAFLLDKYGLSPERVAESVRTHVQYTQTATVNA
jgi:transketolase